MDPKKKLHASLSSIAVKLGVPLRQRRVPTAARRGIDGQEGRSPPCMVSANITRVKALNLGIFPMSNNSNLTVI